ncbi:hypothetical protein ACVWXN_000288 [Bradyrhizobium sp. i1.4.4]|uniref:hypothetical protein n=1 Tax=Bradyrhizobium TaxID=374 RepID=UPI001913060C|nr:hypothetical protein [Bradyrhizobium japonicum]
MDHEFNKQRAIFVRDLADKADPFTRKRLIDLASRYDAGLPTRTGPLPLPSINESPTKR